MLSEPAVSANRRPVGFGGGRQGSTARTGKVIGPSFSAAEVPNAVEKIIGVFTENRHPDETFLDTFDRIGIEPFKNKVYEDRAHGKARTKQEEVAP